TADSAHNHQSYTLFGPEWYLPRRLRKLVAETHEEPLRGSGTGYRLPYCPVAGGIVPVPSIHGKHQPWATKFDYGSIGPHKGPWSFPVEANRVGAGFERYETPIGSLRLPMPNPSDSSSCPGTASSLR